MTKDELKKEARKDADSVSGFDLQTSVMVAKDKNHAYRLGRYDGYLASAEPREKRIAELEKENAELKADNDARKFAMAMSEKVEKQLRNERNTFLAQNEQYEKDLIDFNENLTKAKNLLQKVADVCGYPNYDIPVELYANIADFLKESEVEK